MSEKPENEYVEKFIGDLRTKMIGTKLHGASRNSDFQPTWFENNLGFMAKTYVPDDKMEGKIRFGGDNSTSCAALRTLLLLIDGNPIANKGTDTTRDIAWSFTRQSPGWGDNPQPKLINRLVVGRKNGRYFIAIDEDGRPQPVFYFGPSEHHGVLLNGQPAEQSDISALYAYSWCYNIINAIPTLQKEYYEEVSVLLERWNEKKNKGNKGQNNKPWQKKGWNGNNNNGGNGKPWQKKQWNNNNNGDKPWQKKQWNDNGGKGGNGGDKPWNQNQNQNQNQNDDFADDIPF